MLRPYQGTNHAATPRVGTLSLETARRTLQLEADELAAVVDRLDDSFVRAAELLADCEGAVIVVGVGKSGLVGQKLAATLASTGTPAHFLHPAEALHGDVGRVTASDCVLAISHGGESAEILALLPALRDRGAPLVALCSRASSTLARSADVAVAYGAVEEACPLKLAPSTSCIVAMALGHALAFTLMEYRGYTVEDFQRVHPAGSLGKLMKPVVDVMRTGGQIRTADCRATIREVIVAAKRPGRRTGAILLVNADGRLAGLFTDSDLARVLESNDVAALDSPIDKYMTKAPLTVSANCKVMDAVALLRERHVSELPVIDADGRPVGLVDVTDLMDLLPTYERDDADRRLEQAA
jgi:arabinose-5-phosphate isomerase